MQTTTEAPSLLQPGTWVAQFDCDESRPRIARIRDVYEDPLPSAAGEMLLDLVFYEHSGTRIGRESPPCGGPRGFEPACPASRWVPILAPDFEALAEERFHWGHKLHRR